MQWDDFTGAGLLYMHARHYSPLTGRFLQPDPSAAETNLYGYAGNSPVSRSDPSGLCWRCRILNLEAKARYFVPLLRYYSRVVYTSGGHKYVFKRVPRWHKYSRSAFWADVKAEPGCGPKEWALGVGGTIFSGIGLIASTIGLFTTAPTGLGPVVAAIGFDASLGAMAWSTAAILDCATR